jgi:hypothetical protein
LGEQTRQRLAPKKVLFLRERAREREGDEKESWVQQKILAFAFVVIVVDVALTATRNKLDRRWTARHAVEGKQVKGSQQPAVAVAVAAT